MLLLYLKDSSASTKYVATSFYDFTVEVFMPPLLIVIVTF